MYAGVPSAGMVSVAAGVHDARVDGAGDAEVGDDGLAVLEQDVLRFDVAMHDVLPVGVVQRAGHFLDDAPRARQRDPALAGRAAGAATRPRRAA